MQNRIQQLGRPARLIPALMIAVAIVSGDLPADPLLRENWTSEERVRIQGLVSRLTAGIESPADRYPIPDEAGRQFYIDDRGGLHFEPLYDGVAGNWRPVVPDVRDVPLYFVEAQALYERGLKDEAYYLMKALRAMLLIADDPAARIDSSLRGAIVREASRATRWLNTKQKRDREFDSVDRLTDPYAYYNGAAGWTVVVSDHFGWRLRLPGSWRFQRGQDRYSRAGDPSRNMVYLRHNDWLLAIGSDEYSGTPGRFVDLTAFIREWDLRRTLTPGRKRVLSFLREKLADDFTVCSQPTGSQPTGSQPTGSQPTGSQPTGSQPTGMQPTGMQPTGMQPTGMQPTGMQPTGHRDECALFRTSLRDRRRSYSFREYYRLLATDRRGLYLQFSYDLPAEAPAAAIQEQAVTEILRQIIASLRITKFR